MLTGEHLCEFDSWVRAKRMADATGGKRRATLDGRELITEAVTAYLKEPLNLYRMLDEMQSFPGANWVIVKALMLANTTPPDIDNLLAASSPAELHEAVCAVVPMWRRLKPEDPIPAVEVATT